MSTVHAPTDFAGRLLSPGDAGYDEARSVFNGMIDRRPAVIASCGGPADVAAALAIARDNGLEVSIRGGGHAPSGDAVADGALMVDCSPMKRIDVDPERRTARVGAGVTWAELDAATQAHWLAVTGGRGSTRRRGPHPRFRERLDRAVVRPDRRQPPLLPPRDGRRPRGARRRGREPRALLRPVRRRRQLRRRHGVRVRAAPARADRGRWARPAPVRRGRDYVDDPARVSGFFSERTWERLVAAKREWDPGNVFHHNQNISPAG